jgi:hypothetical protein
MCKKNCFALIKVKIGENKGEKVGRSLLVKEQGRLMATAK